MAKVFVELIAGKIDIEDLQKVLKTSRWSIVNEENKYWLTSDILGCLSEPREIISKADEFLDSINGAANIFYSNHRKVISGNLKTINHNGRINHAIIAGTARIVLSIRARGTLTALGNDSIKQSTIEYWLEKSEKHTSVRDALHFFNEITWWNLYKVYEVIKDDVGGKKNLTKLIDRKQLNHFTQAAQSREMLGDKARHASKKYKAPEHNLTLDQANGLIIKLFDKWISIK